MNLGMGHTVIIINYQTTWSQHVTPIVLGKTSMLPISTYLMWYNVIPPFVHLDPSLYPAYPTRTKGLDSLIFMSQPYFEKSVRMRLTLPEWELGSPPGLPKISKFDCRGQNTSHCGVLYIIGKLLKRRYQKWSCMSHLDICSTSYGKNKDH
jgi:hypothetical protein